MIYLRKAKEQDLDIIRDLAHRTWWDTYGGYLSDEQIRYMLEKMYNRGELLGQLQQGYVFLIAAEQEQDLGFAAYSIVDSDQRIFKLHKLYVLPEAHGKGIGKLLMNEVADLVKKAGATALQLNVNRNNKAAGFYLKSGFVIKNTIDLDIGGGFFMNDYVMEKPIVS